MYAPSWHGSNFCAFCFEVFYATSNLPKAKVFPWSYPNLIDYFLPYPCTRIIFFIQLLDQSKFNYLGICALNQFSDSLNNSSNFFDYALIAAPPDVKKLEEYVGRAQINPMFFAIDSSFKYTYLQ